ncbi:hypothetical protein HML84_21150 [Alcanivorax sp. IO_7]|nr:hypothetical protein HML84_21150 [Alcanivorax sp. IO_7]
MPFQDYTLIQAPMAGGINATPLTVGAARAGALASIGAGYLSGAALEEAVTAARQGGADAFAVNLFIPGEAGASEAQWRAAREALVPCYEAAGVACRRLSPSCPASTNSSRPCSRPGRRSSASPSGAWTRPVATPAGPGASA